MKVFEQTLSHLAPKDKERVTRNRESKVTADTLLLARNLVAPHYSEQQHRTTKDGTPIPDESDISKMFKSASTAVRDARNILKSSPELCMGIDIYIAGLLSPNDVSAPDLNITSTLSGEMVSIKSKLLEVVREWAKDEYKIDTRLKDWVFRAKYLQGAMPLGVIPLTAIDSIINEEDESKRKVALESYDANTLSSNGIHKPTGLLGPGLNSAKGYKNRSVFQALKIATESGQGNTASDNSNFINLNHDQKTKIMNVLKDEKNLGTKTIDAIGNIFIHDNVEALKMPNIAAAAIRRSIKNRYSPLYNMAMEDDAKNADVVEKNSRTIDLEQGKLVYPDRHYSLNEVVNVRPSDLYENVGHPLVQEFPYDSIFPISPPGLPDRHIGYIAALDSTGSPLTLGDEGMAYPDPSDISMQTSSGVMGTQMLSQIADASIDGMTNLRFGALNNASNRLFNTFLIADLKERFKNGLYNGIEVDIKFTQVFLEQMWRRAMMGQQVQFLFIPTELMTYIAFEYNETGMGESKLIKHRDVAIVASTVQIANALTAVNNSIQHKKATIGFDDDEIDAFDTDEKLKQYIVRSQWANTLFSSSNTQDQLNHILNSGWHFAYENGNGAFPGTTFDIEYLTREANQIDNEYLDTVNKRLIMLSGVSPEIVDMSQEVEFAQTYITGHMLRAQQAALEQQILCKGLTKFVQSFCLNSQIIIRKLYNIIKDAKTGENSTLKGSKKSERVLIEEFIESIETSLPKPDTTKLEAQKDNLATHEEYIDKVIEYYFNDPLFEASEVGEKLGEKLDLFKAVWKASYMRGVLQTNNLVPAQFQALHGNVDDEDFVDPFIEAEQLVKNFSKLALQHESEISRLRTKNDTTVENIQARVEGGEGGGGNNNDDSSSNESTDTDADNNPDTGDGGDGSPAPTDGEDDGDDLFGDGGGADNPLG